MAEGDFSSYPVLRQPETSTFGTSSRGGKVLRDSNHYEYNFNRSSGDRKFWICIRSRSKLHPFCPGRATTQGDKTISTRAHNHISDPTTIKVKDSVKKIITKAKENPTLKTAHLLGEWAKETLSPAERSQAMLRWSMRRKIQRCKNTVQNQPPIPRDFNELAELPEQYTNTVDNERFLLFNEEVEGQGRMILFASGQGLMLLQRSETWSLDGTFACMPDPFMQLYTVMAELNNRSYPCFFGLLPNKRGPTYAKMLEVLKEAVEAKGPLHLQQVMMDFESAVIREFKATFSRRVEVQGCQVHLFRNWRKKLQEVGNLISWSCAQVSFNKFLKSMHGLCYVPIDKVHEYFKALCDTKLESICTELDERKDLDLEEKDATKESLNAYLDFLERNYIGRQTRSGISVPRFPPELWSQIGNCLEGRPLSTNRNEGFHSRLKHNLPQNNHIWALLTHLVNIEAETRTIRDEHRVSLGVDGDDSEEDGQGEDGKQPGNAGAYRRWKMRRNIRNLIVHIEEYTPVDYLERVSHIEPW
jgi:hypothetical protein